MSWILFLLPLAMAAPFKHAVRNHTQCTHKEIERKDCLLRVGTLQLQVSQKKLTWNDGTWTSIVDAPMTEDANVWDKMKLENKTLAKRTIFQAWIWDAALGENKVESLHWIVGELKERQYVPYLDEIVRKRRVKPTTPVTYSYDPLIPHQIKTVKKELTWVVGHRNGPLGKK
jgi:hypothetical protein